jgi:hypothetical protein
MFVYIKGHKAINLDHVLGIKLLDNLDVAGKKTYGILFEEKDEFPVALYSEKSKRDADFWDISVSVRNIVELHNPEFDLWNL